MSVSPSRAEPVNPSAPFTSAQSSTVLFRTVNRVAFITLNRPSALNALDLPMIQQIAQYLEQCRHDAQIVAVVIHSDNEKAFCAGGDVRALLRSDAKRADIERFFIDEYRLDYAIHRFPKPVVVVMHGVTMGGGMGLAQGASLRIVTERSRIAMPETKIGLVPDVGATHFLSVMNVETELYVGLTGVALSGADAVACGLADVCVPYATLADVDTRLASLDTQALAIEPDALVRALRDAFVVSEINVGDAPIRRQQQWIGEHFSRERTPLAIVASLRAARDALPEKNTSNNPTSTATHYATRNITRTATNDAAKDADDDPTHEEDPTREERDWLDAAWTALTRYSPTMIHVTREALLRGREITLADSFRMEMGIVMRAITEGDFREGVRAHLVDKDGAPAWQPATLAAVTPERVAHFLSSPWPEHGHPLATLGPD